MDPSDITVQILTEIRDEIRSTNGRIDQTNVRLDRLGTDLGGRIDNLGTQVNKRIDQLSERVVESEIRTATAINELGGTMRDVRDLLKDRGLRLEEPKRRTAGSPDMRSRLPTRSEHTSRSEGLRIRAVLDPADGSGP